MEVPNNLGLGFRRAGLKFSIMDKPLNIAELASSYCKTRIIEIPSVKGSTRQGVVEEMKPICTRYT